MIATATKNSARNIIMPSTNPATAIPLPETFRPSFVLLIPTPPKMIANGQIPKSPNTNEATANPLVRCMGGFCTTIVTGEAGV